MLEVVREQIMNEAEVRSHAEKLQDFHNPLRALDLVVAAVDHKQQVMPMALHHVLNEPVSFEPVKAEEVLERLKDSAEPLPQYITSRGKAPYLDYSKFKSVMPASLHARSGEAAHAISPGMAAEQGAAKLREGMTCHGNGAKAQSQRRSRRPKRT